VIRKKPAGDSVRVNICFQERWALARQRAGRRVCASSIESMDGILGGFLAIGQTTTRWGS
jgi:hypothetical protein